MHWLGKHLIDHQQQRAKSFVSLLPVPCNIVILYEVFG